MSRRVSPSTDQVYGLQRVTRIWGVSRATVYRHRHQPEAIERRRPGPLGAMADEELVRAIRQLLQDSPFHGEGYRKLWARLRFAGIRTSRRRVLRLMREHGLLAHQRAGRPRGSRAHDGTITTERFDAMWGTDLTSVITGEGQAAVFITVDHCSAECVAFTPAAAPIASRRSSRSVKACASASAPLATTPRAVSPFATITAPST